jgi:hypothetical protein
MRVLFLVTATALVVAGCQKPAGAPAAGAPAAATATASPVATPHRRAGLWEQSFSRDGHATPMASMRLCVDPAMEAKASVLSHGVSGPHDSHCMLGTVSRGLDGSYSFSSTCPTAGGGTVTTKGQASGDFSNAYHLHIESDVTGADYAAMNGHHVTDVDGKWLGPCPTGMAAGDMELGNGIRISGGKLAGAAAALARGGQ